MEGHWFLRGLCFARPNHTAHDRASDIHRLKFKINIAPFQPKQLTLPQTRRSGEQYQYSFSSGEPIQEELDFSGRKHTWWCFPLGPLTNQTDRIEIEQLVTASVIKDHGHQVADLRTTTFCKRESPEP
jgi:hypothetical protein